MWTYCAMNEQWELFYNMVPTGIVLPFGSHMEAVVNLLNMYKATPKQ